MRVHLVNPSDVSFGIAVITPRWLYRAGGGDAAAASAIPSICRRNARAVRSLRSSSRATSSASASTPATRCAATKSAAPPARAAPRSCTAASTRRCIPTRPTSSAAPTPWSTATATRLGRRASPTAQPARRSRSTTAAASTATVLAGALGSAAARSLHVGVGADRARLPEALLVLLGLAHRRPGAAHARASTPSSREIVELRRRGFRFIALADDNFYPVALEDLAMAERRADKTHAARARGDARRALRADGAARAAAATTWCSSRRSRWRRPRIPSSSTRCASAHQGRARRRRSR